MIDAEKLLKSLKWLKTGIFKSNYRKNLRSIFFKQTQGKLELFSSNAFCVFSETFELPDKENNCFEFSADEKYLFEITGLLESAIKGNKGMVFCEIQDGKIIIESEKLERQIQKSEIPFLEKAIELFDKNTEQKLEYSEIKLNSKILQLCLKGFESPVIKFYGELEPVLIAEEDSLYPGRKALIMPIKQNKRYK